MPGTLAIICSDEPRNGKTLFGRLFAACLSLSGDESFRVFDTDYPHGELAGYFPASSKIVDFSKTLGQVTVFDTIIGEPDFDYIIDLQPVHLDRFFEIFDDIGFDEAAVEAGVAVSVYFLIDRVVTSVQAAARISTLLNHCEFVPVRNDAIGNILNLPQAAKIYADMRKTRELTMPRLSIDALNFIDRPDFTFAGFIANNGMDAPLELRIEIWNFLETVYNQRQAVFAGGPVIM